MMKIGKLLVKQGYLQCSNCKMRPVAIEYMCPYCGCKFSNYEEIMMEAFMDVNEDDISFSFDEGNLVD